MLFNTLQFLLFFVGVIVLHFSLPARWRWALLLAASYYFYMCWKAEYVVLIAGSTLLNFYSAKKIAASNNPKVRKVCLSLSLLVCLGVLFGFKYFNFLSVTIQSLCRAMSILYDTPLLNVMLPVGISFYTFQTLSYTIDVYRGQVEPESHLGIFALYVSFFPQLVAGPIERSGRLLPQRGRRALFQYDRATSGLRLMLWGFFKKIVIADRLAVIVSQVYNQPSDHQGLTLIVATLFFAFQIFCDFSGYSDIAVGAARVMGVDLMRNFRRPYFAGSFREFWQRWHISLSTWFRDYLYVPIGGGRGVKWRQYHNLLVTFAVSGLWHGANWTFVVWGLLHGVFVVMERAITASRTSGPGGQRLSSLQRALRVAFVFTMVCVAWVFFRADSVPDAFTILRGMPQVDVVTQAREAVRIGGGIGSFSITLSLLLFLVGGQALDSRIGVEARFACWPTPLRWSIYCIALWGVFCLGTFESRAFIYFQF